MSSSSIKNTIMIVSAVLGAGGVVWGAIEIHSAYPHPGAATQRELVIVHRALCNRIDDLEAHLVREIRGLKE